MTDLSIYADIADRTGGDIYIGVAGPVRTGKSTLIKRFLENMIIPNIEGDFVRERAKDEMPQSASGRTVMTTEPKFIPETAVSVPLGENVSAKVKLIDCVGYMVDGAAGLTEEGQPRMVMTPWSDSPLPFEQAAETGTKKVIADHSTVGIVVTTDGSIGEIPRDAYKDAEKRVISELKALKKPFITVLNCVDPDSRETKELALSLENEYDVPVIPLNCLEAGEKEITEILKNLLYEFPVSEIKVRLPRWLDILDKDNELKSGIYGGLNEKINSLSRVGEIKDAFSGFFDESENAASSLDTLDLGKGSACVTVEVPEKIFYSVLSEKSGLEINDEYELLKNMEEMSEIKKKYDKVASAIDDVMNDGYGIVMP